MEAKKWFGPGEDLMDAAVVRLAVFVDEQGFSKELEFDNIDAVAHHIVFYADKEPVATGRLFPDDHPGSFHAGRIAVQKSLRGTGMGRKIMEEMERRAAELGGDSIVLSAQCQARAFYEKNGYTAFGEEYLDEHCPHIDMKKQL